MGAELVFCFPHAGGGMHHYLAWAAAFNGEFEWIPVEYPGHFTRDDEPCYSTFADAVADLTEEIETSAAGKRVGIVGHSLGGSLAYETGRRLAARQRIALDALVVSSAEPPALAGNRQRYFELDDEELMTHLQALDGARAESSLWRKLVTGTLPLIRSDYRLHHSYRPDPQTSIDVPLHICAGRDEPMSSERILAWRHHTSASAEFHRFSGGHFYWQADPAGITTVLRDVFADRPSSKETGASACRY